MKRETSNAYARAEIVAIEMERIYDLVLNYANNPDSEGNSTRESIIPLMI